MPIEPLEFNPEFAVPKVVPLRPVDGPPQDLVELMTSFGAPVDELAYRLQETLKAAGYEGTVHLTLQARVDGRSWLQNRHVTWGKEYQSSTRTFEETGFNPVPVNARWRTGILIALTASGCFNILAGLFVNATWGFLGLGALAVAALVAMTTRPASKVD